jgi:hypothetical protein
METPKTALQLAMEHKIESLDKLRKEILWAEYMEGSYNEVPNPEKEIVLHWAQLERLFLIVTGIADSIAFSEQEKMRRAVGRLLERV